MILIFWYSCPCLDATCELLLTKEYGSSDAMPFLGPVKLNKAVLLETFSLAGFEDINGHVRRPRGQGSEDSL